MVCPQQNLKDTGDCTMAAKAGSIDYKLSANENQFTPFLSKRLELEILTQGQETLFPHCTWFKGDWGNSISSAFNFQTEPHMLSFAPTMTAKAA